MTEFSLPKIHVLVAYLKIKVSESVCYSNVQTKDCGVPHQEKHVDDVGQGQEIVRALAPGSDDKTKQKTTTTRKYSRLGYAFLPCTGGTTYRNKFSIPLGPYVVSGIRLANRNDSPGCAYYFLQSPFGVRCMHRVPHNRTLSHIRCPLYHGMPPSKCGVLNMTMYTTPPVTTFRALQHTYHPVLTLRGRDIQRTLVIKWVVDLRFGHA